MNKDLLIIMTTRKKNIFYVINKSINIPKKLTETDKIARKKLGCETVFPNITKEVFCLKKLVFTQLK